jgi:hypothetical protein
MTTLSVRLKAERTLSSQEQSRERRGEDKKKNNDTC